MNQPWSQTTRHIEERSGNDPQSVSHRSHCLANKSRRLQGLLSIECGTPAVVGAPTQDIPLFVFTTGYDPITSDVSDRRSTNWATWTYCGQGRVRSYNPRINSTMLSRLSYLSILLWEQMESNHQDDVLQTRSGPCRYSLFLYTLQGSNLWPVVCKTTATTIWAKSVF